MKEKFYNKIMINGEIDSQTYQTVLNTCINILETGNTDDILVIINSNGGVVEDTNAIIDLLDIMPNRKTTVIVGRAESSAGILFLHMRICIERQETGLCFWKRILKRPCFSMSWRI